MWPDSIPPFRKPDRLVDDRLRSQLSGLFEWLDAELARAPAFASHLGKYRSLMPSLALIFHLLDVATGSARGPVSEDATLLAANWVDYLELHARKVFGSETAPGVTGAKALAQAIEAGKVVDRMPVRDIYRAGWADLRSRDAVYEAIARLTELAWCRTEKPPKKGKRGQSPGDVIRLHPDLRGGKRR